MKDKAAYIAGFIDGYQIMQENCREASQWNGELPLAKLIEIAAKSFKQCIRSPKP